ncbi:hypothetical protein EMIHUDRAFT_199336 [Emiliania huxleyi CCMP1516]|uniref:SAP domain-containing protein n=2 Tax=Emiliania huxleyi TaxID=2903 RepID=A0A0D3KZE7_EMIH1|nr:hypothetical protein EMIHUDRAFT_199336 [Emiliania huxleyi CCMP1516]EOD41132.1 hypothetical protein EMIHUDRAFT_199336 [Emiliania huxleyi CCMP1516]|eukprot:XP_005793561.1 hypothetical protein EMIHUDRAFT_199336 [Emiliania huxleyi CCMP1516]
MSFGTGSTSLAWKVGGRLSVRALLFDARVLMRHPHERARKEQSRPAAPIIEPDVLRADTISSMLISQLRDHCRQQGLSNVGDRDELVGRLTDFLAKAAVTVEATASAGAASPRDKYADKLRSRGAAQLLHHGRDADAGGPLLMTEFGRVEKEREKAVRRHSESERRAQVDTGGYAFQPGAKDLLHYLDMRGMLRLLLPSDDDDDVARMEAQAASLAESLQVPPFATSLDPAAAARARRGEAEALGEVAEALDLTPGSVMVVSDHSTVVAAARRARMLSCYVAKPIEGRPRRLPADFCVDELSLTRGCIEECNGATFRDGNTEIISRYVGGD